MNKPGSGTVSRKNQDLLQAFQNRCGILGVAICWIATRARGKMPRGKRQYPIDLQQIREALIMSGYSKLDQQAKALGLHRSTAWTIVKAKHKLGRLNAQTTRRILANPDTPPDVRSVIQKHSREKANDQINRFRCRRLSRHNVSASNASRAGS
ncbi:MAG: hypothetical protein WCF15_03035 [Pseudolabrys sp.]